jgi:hypothetical protein
LANFSPGLESSETTLAEERETGIWTSNPGFYQPGLELANALAPQFKLHQHLKTVSLT